ncbi:iron-containing alcohol dehydrogenase [Streptococcus catagoni]|uniref:iron-containing alcohol dehydrogenase n=1 Tax=Streptococcus catagoni TaxID=2654874 RepID=UPI0014086DAE|nr:iron-containing alcohol dehydrogenase [Streptococcus catagoni]
MQFNLEQPVKIKVCRDSDKVIAEIVLERQYQKPLLVIDSYFLNHSKIKELLKRFEDEGLTHVIYDQITTEPSIEQIDRGAKVYKDNKCDCIISIGGGSIIDGARGINIVQQCGGSIKDYMNGKAIPQRLSGQIALATTSGTGSELSNALVVTDPDLGKKIAILSDNILSDYAIIDAGFLTTLPKSISIMTGLDAFSHAFEAYTSKLSTPMVDVLCEKVMFLLRRYLPKVVSDRKDIEARERVAIAAALSGLILNNGGTHIGHSLAHIVGATYKIPHGACVAYALPATIKQVAKVLPKKVEEVGYILGLDPSGQADIGSFVSQGFLAFRDEILGLRPFEEYQISKAELLKLTDEVLEERFIVNSPIPVNKELVEQVLEDFG